MANKTNPQTAVLLIAHGSRQAEANADLFHIADELRKRGPYAIVEPAFLELAEPTIDRGGEKCVQLGAKRVLLLPYFLSAGVHARQDLAAIRDQLAKRFGDVDFFLGEPLGTHPLLVDIVAERARQIEERSENASLRKPANSVTD